MSEEYCTPDSTRLDRIIELLEQRIKQAEIAGEQTERALKVSETAMEIMKPKTVGCEGHPRPFDFVPFDQTPGEILHYPLPGDPEPTSQPEFNPVLPEDRAAVERWKQEQNTEETYSIVVEGETCMKCGKVGGKVVTFHLSTGTTASRWICPYCLDEKEEK